MDKQNKEADIKSVLNKIIKPDKEFISHPT